MGCRFLLLLAFLAACSGEGTPAPPTEEDPPPAPAPEEPGPFGLTQRVTVTGLTFPTSQQQPGEYQVVDAFPNLSFSKPVVLTYAPGDRTRIFVADQSGKIEVFANDPSTSTKKTFLDIQSKVYHQGEAGFLGLAFDPDYQSNGYFYVYYSVSPSSNHRTLARYKVSSSDSDAADPNSATLLLDLEQDSEGHNGGCLAFGPDGYLYLSTGDGQLSKVAQDKTLLNGKILRLTKTGGIPSDNPFVGDGGGVREEIWAYGFRNPWRMGFDRDTGDLWVGDVGLYDREEVDIVVKGGNYGWSIFEGDIDYENGGGVNINTTELPIRAYPRSEGQCVIGGYVYRGGNLPSLRGAYVHGDYGNGRMYAVVYDGSTATTTLIATVYNTTAFGEDADGELYICTFDGAINRLEETSPGGSAPFPDKLSGTGLFSNVAALTPAPGVIEYDVNAPLWSDGARKRRWIALPGTTRIGFDPTGAWTFPVGTVLVKHFELETTTGTQRLETRVLIREETGWHGYTYRWNAAQTDADLLAGAESAPYEVPDPSAPGGTRTQTWNFPSRTDCLSCHTSAAGRVLGVRTNQLNGDFAYTAATDNQLRSWNNIQLFTTDIGDHAQYVALPDPADTTAPVAERARAYLEVNCAMCHRPGGPVPTTIDLRAATSLALMNAVDVVPSQSDFGLANARIIASGSKESSVLWERMRIIGGGRMPALGSIVVDQAAVDLVGEWIDTGPQ